MAHTPGPWKVTSLSWGWQIMPKRDESQAHVIAAIGSGVSSSGNKVEKFFKEQKANANLMAAAPALLASCEEILKWVDTYYDIGSLAGELEDAIEQTREAVLTAKGVTSWS